VYFLSDTLKSDALGAACESVRSDIKRVGGTVKSEKNVEHRAFVRPIAKKQGGFYYELVFDLDPAKVAALKERHKLNANIFRSMITVTPTVKAEPVATATVAGA